MWLSTPGTLGRNLGGRTLLCCVLSARTSDSCSWDPRPGRLVHRMELDKLFCHLSLLASRSSASHCTALFSAGWPWRISCWISSLIAQGTSPVAVCLQRAGWRPPFAALHLGWGIYWWHATIRGAPLRTPLSSGGEGPPPVHVFVGNSHVHLQR